MRFVRWIPEAGAACKPPSDQLAPASASLSLPCSFPPLPPFNGTPVTGMSAALRGTAVQQRASSARTAAAAPVQAAAVQTRKLKAKDAPKPPPPPPRKAAGGTVKVSRCWWRCEALPCRTWAGRCGRSRCARPACVSRTLHCTLLCIGQRWPLPTH